MIGETRANKILLLAANPSVIVRRGGNSTVTQVNIGNSTFAVKDYSARDNGIDRMEREWWALQLLEKAIPNLAPLPLWRKEGGSIAIHSWVEGSIPKLNMPTVNAMLEILDLLLLAYLRLERPGSLKAAVDSLYLRPSLQQQISLRLELINERVSPEIPIIVKQIATCLEDLSNRPKTETPIDLGKLTLSPSDFGPHNLLFDSQAGKMSLVDLEFFGVDSPLKLIGDTILNPQALWKHDTLSHFLVEARKIFNVDMRSLEKILPLLSLKWAAIAAGRLIRPDLDSSHDILEISEKVHFYCQLSMTPSIDSFLSRIIGITDL